MQELFAQVLNQKDLSKAGDLFSVEDKDIENDLSEVIKPIHVQQFEHDDVPDSWLAFVISAWIYSTCSKNSAICIIQQGP